MKKHFVICTLLLAITTLAGAQGIDAKILKLQKSTYSSPFTETKVMPKLKKETVKTGTLVWTAPANLRMDYSDPEGDYTLIEDENFSLSVKGMVQKLPAKDANSKTGLLRLTLINAFQGNVAEIATLTNAQPTYSDKGGRYVCELVAERPKHGVKSLTLEYDKKNGHLLLLTITENNGNYTTWAVK